MENVSISAGADTWYDMLFRTNPLPMLIFDRDLSLCMDANASAACLYGQPVERLKGANLHQLLANIDPCKDAPPETGIADLLVEREESGIFGVRSSTATEPLYVQVVRHAIHDGHRDADLLILHDVTAQRKRELALRTAERDLNQAQVVARLGSFVHDFITDNERWSDQIYRNFGLEPHSIPSSYGTFLNLVHPDDRDMVHATIFAAAANREPYTCIHRVVWPDGSVHVMQENGLVIYDNAGSPLELIGTTLDITHQHQVETALRKAQDDLKKAQEVGHIGAWAFDPQTGEFDSWSDETFRIFGFPIGPETPRLSILLPRLHPDDRDRTRLARERALMDPSFHYDVEFRIWNPQRGERVLHSQAEVQFQHGKAVRMVGLLQDITEKKRAEEQIRHLAYYDTTTGLPNRILLEEFAQQALDAFRSKGTPASMLMIYLERFRDVNYTLGHADGDAILKQVGACIRDVLGPASVVARVGNAQFAAVLPGLRPSATLPHIREVFAALERPFPISGINYALGANIGVSGTSDCADDVKTFIRRANVAQYQARQLGQAYAIYDPAIDPYNPRRLALIGEFRKSVRDGQLQLYCQPKIDLRSRTIVGAEALVRWQHPVLGRVTPDQFVPQIEATDLIHDLTRYMLDASIRQALEWKKLGMLVPMAVNVSPRNLMEPDFAEHVKQLLEVSGLPPEGLGLEITEGSLIADPQRTIDELRRLASMGLPIFVDDFGTGYSSLSYLISLPVDVIKIDHSFTMHMLENRNCAAVVRSTIELAHNLGMKVVAEGTASRQIWDALTELGCDEGQGHFISPPLPASDFLSWTSLSGFALQPA